MEVFYHLNIVICRRNAMLMDKLIGSQSVIITLNADSTLFEKLEQISKTSGSLVEINSSDEFILRKAIQLFPDLILGAGNVVNTQQLHTCHQANVKFITSPGFLPSLVQTAALYSICYLPGIATLSEAMQAVELDCQNVRLYPSSLEFCTQLNDCFPTLKLFPADVSWEEASHFLNIPSVAAVSVMNLDMWELGDIAFSDSYSGSLIPQAGEGSL